MIASIKYLLTKFPNAQLLLFTFLVEAVEIDKTKVLSPSDTAGHSQGGLPFNPALRKPRKNNNYTYRP